MSTTYGNDVGTGPVVVLLHAFPCDHRMWVHQVGPITAAGWRVVVPDLPGFGESSLPVDDPALGAVVHELRADLVGRGIDRFVLAGLSVGGYLAMEWLRRFPEDIAGLCLCDTKATTDPPAVLEGRLAMAEQVLANPAQSAQIVGERMMGPIVGPTTHARRPEVVAQVQEWITAAPAASIAWYQRAMATRPSSQDTLRALEAPALVVWGEEDAMSPREEQMVMLECLADAELVTIPQAGHLSALENPEPVTGALVDFLAAVRGSTLQG